MAHAAVHARMVRFPHSDAYARLSSLQLNHMYGASSGACTHGAFSSLPREWPLLREGLGCSFPQLSAGPSKMLIRALNAPSKNIKDATHGKDEHAGWIPRALRFIPSTLHSEKVGL